MRNFIINTFSFLVFFILINTVFALIYIYKHNITHNDIPALNFSDSYSFNEKIRFMRKQERSANVLAIGSSMSQNNLHSKTIVSNMHTDHYINTASWGMSMFDDFVFLKSLDKIYKIKYLIIASSITDFQQTEKNIDLPFVESYVKHDDLSAFVKFIRSMDVKYYKRNWSYARKVRACAKDYEYLNYDSYGAVNFRKDSFNIDKKRWVDDYLANPGLKLQYDYLDSISDYCVANGVELLFFQTPIRQGISSNLELFKSNNLAQHIRKVKYILKQNNQSFINSSEKLWPDTLFTDAIHFNAAGAQLFTQFCFDKIITETSINR